MCRTPQDNAPSSRPRPCRQTDWLGVATCAVVGCLILALCWFKVGNLDTGYHVAYGRHFLTTGEIVQRDPFLYPETAVSFVNANWGSQVIMAAAESAAGAGGLIALRIGLIAIIFTGIAMALRHLLGATSAHPLTLNRQSSIVNPQSSTCPWIAWAWLLAGIAAYERFSMRPELFSYAAMSVMLVLLVRGLRSWRGVVVIAGLQLVWVNLHSYFLVGILLTVAWLVGEITVGLPRRRGRPDHDRVKRRIGLLAAVLAVQCVACLANPWHWRGAVFPLTTLEFLHGAEVMGGAAGGPSGSAWSEISEFQSPFSFYGEPINARTIHAYSVLLAVALTGLIAMLRQRQVASILVVGVFFAMSIQMRRNVAQFALVASPLSVAALAVFLRQFAPDRSFGRWVRTAALVVTIALSGWWIAGIANGRFYYVERRISREFGTGYSDRTHPRAAVTWLADRTDLQPRLFVDYFSSSNTLLWLPAKYRLFVDTNTFAYSDETLNTAFKLGLGKVDHNRFFSEHEVNVVLLHCGPDTQVLVGRLVADSGEWAMVYFDRHTVVFVRRIPAHVPVILANEPTEQDLDAAAWIASTTGPARGKALGLMTAANVPTSLKWFRPASVLLAEAVRLAPDYYEAWHNLGVCHGNLGNAAARSGRYEAAQRHWNEALACFQNVLALSPDHGEAASYLADTQKRLRLLPAVRSDAGGARR